MVQNCLGRRRLAGIDMGNDPNISNPLERIFFSNCFSHIYILYYRFPPRHGGAVLCFALYPPPAELLYRLHSSESEVFAFLEINQKEALTKPLSARGED